jgi:polyhydroxyalkanoate synthesis regulator phasin
MRSWIEKGFVMGLGALALGRDKARSLVDDMARRSGGKDLVDRAVERGEQERSQLKEKIRTGMSELLSDIGFATRADIEELNRKVGGPAKKAKAS